MVSASVRHALNRDPVSEPLLVLLEFAEDGGGDVHRMAVNNEDVVSNGETFSAVAAEVTLPGAGDQSPGVSITISNIDRTLGAAVFRARRRVGVRVRLVAADDPDTAIIDTRDMMVLASASGDSISISGDLAPRGAALEPVSARVTRQFFPGLYFR